MRVRVASFSKSTRTRSGPESSTSTPWPPLGVAATSRTTAPVQPAVTVPPAPRAVRCTGLASSSNRVVGSVGAGVRVPGESGDAGDSLPDLDPTGAGAPVSPTPSSPATPAPARVITSHTRAATRTTTPTHAATPTSTEREGMRTSFMLSVPLRKPAVPRFRPWPASWSSRTTRRSAMLLDLGLPDVPGLPAARAEAGEVASAP